MDESAIEVATAVRAGERKATEVLDEALSAIDAGNDALGAFVHVDERLAREAAEAVDAAVAAGRDPGPFAGVPIGVKDLEDCAGMPTSRGSLVYKGRPPVEHDSIHVARLRGRRGAGRQDGGAGVRHAQLHAHEGVGRGPQPVGPERTPGGSSGGSAAAVAAAMLPVATASDGGGSTRIPAAFSGLVGFKPSHGRIPHPGAPGSETAVYGLLTTTVADSARHLDVVAGPDDRDRFSLPASGRAYESAIESLPVEGLRARWSADLGFARCDPEVRALAEAAARELAEAAGLVLDDEPVELTDPVRTWLGAGTLDLWLELEPGAWPGVKDDLTRYSRSVLEQTEQYRCRRCARRRRSGASS